MVHRQEVISLGRNDLETECVTLAEAPTGVILGTAKIARRVRENGHYEWHLSDVKRVNKPCKPKRSRNRFSSGRSEITRCLRDVA